MVAKRKAENSGEVGAKGESYQIDWRAQPRRPFKRGFILYGTEASTAEALKKRKALGLELIEDPAGEDATPLPLESFEEPGALPPWLLDGLRDDFRYEPTALQAQALPIALAGQNLVAVAKQGCGQAGAYLVPASVQVEDQPAIDEEDPGPIVLVLAPTQEIAEKVSEEAKVLLTYSDRSARHPEGLRTVCVSGGGTRSEKLRELGPKGAHVVVGTPKRVHDMASKEQISLLRVTMLILDGADKMLDLGFEAELRELAAWVRPERQTMVFATLWPKTLHDLALEFCFAGGAPVRFTAGGASGAAKAAKAADAKAAKAKSPAAAKAKDLQAARAAAGAKAKAATAGEAAIDGEATGDLPDEW